MSVIRLALSVLIFTLVSLPAQTTQPVLVQPDCVVYFTFTATASTAVIDNRYKSCQEWQVTYNSTGFSALSLVAQSAPNNGGVPGTWVNLAGTVASGANPNTAITQARTVWTNAYNPFIRMTLSSVTGTGTVAGVLLGWNRTGASGGAAANVTVTNFPATQNVQGSAAAGTVAAGINPVLIALQNSGSGNTVAPLADANGNTQVVGSVVPGGASSTVKPVIMGAVDGGGAVRAPLADTGGRIQTLVNANGVSTPINQCDRQAGVTLSTPVSSQLVAGSPGTKIHVCTVFMFSGGTPQSYTLEEADAGSSCSTGSTAIWSGFITSNPVSIGSGLGQVVQTQTTGKALCATNTTVSAALRLEVSYAQY